MNPDNLNLQDQPELRFYEIASCEDLPEGERLFFEVGEDAIMLINLGGEYLAIGDVCTHDDGPLGEGILEGQTIVCPRHGARFDIRTGKALSFPAVIGTPTYPVRISAGKIEVGIPQK
jgi:3-phenylpropionate/trans-cinnamate dioxygenase ferredoxin component